jgi:diguanylate cyclase (GGDEF)-like protein
MTEVADRLWLRHFRDPVAACTEAQHVVATAPGHAHELAWAELTIAYHHLFYTSRPAEAREWLARAQSRFESHGERRGVILAQAGSARLGILEHAALPARERLLSLLPDAQSLPPHDRFYVLNALAASYYFNEEIEEAIRYLYEALEALNAPDPSPLLPTVMSNLSAALVTVGDYVPARELAESALAGLTRFNNSQLVLFARSNLAEALVGLGDLEGATEVIDTMVADLAESPRRAAQNNYMSTATEVYARAGRLDSAAQCLATAQAIAKEFPGGFNEVNALWAEAALADASGPPERAIATLEAATTAAERSQHLPVLCKTHALLAERYASCGDFEHAYAHMQRLLIAQTQRLSHRASAKYYLLRTEHELLDAREERDRALTQRLDTERLNQELAALNLELSLKVKEIEALQQRLAEEAVHDPLTQLFNRRYLDSVMPGLIASAERRGAPLAVALVDLDRFKRINDHHGHPAGDAVLREIGRVFGNSLRPSDVVCRYGGEEFCIVLPDTDVEGARAALNGLSARLKGLNVPWRDSRLNGFTFSAGVAVLPRHGRYFPELLAAADRTLYSAKAAGRDRVMVADPPSPAPGA